LQGSTAESEAQKLLLSVKHKRRLQRRLPLLIKAALAALRVDLDFRPCPRVVETHRWRRLVRNGLMGAGRVGAFVAPLLKPVPAMAT
jgi:hypothetical protein